MRITATPSVLLYANSNSRIISAEDIPLCFDNIIEIQQFGQNTTSDIYLLKWATSFGILYHHQAPFFTNFAELFLKVKMLKYEGWNFNFGNTPLDRIQELLE